MGHRRGLGPTLFAAALVVAACAPDADVEVEDAMLIAGPLTPDGQATFPEASSSADTAPGEEPAPTTSITWEGCDGYGIPDRATQTTSGWECGRLVVPMDPYGSDSTETEVDLGVTRHRATGTRRGAIVVNPGGPGAAGLPVAWNIREGMPTALLRGFDIVSWDPRGIGQSTPRITCDGADSFDDDFIARCVDATGPLSGYLSAPYNAADMEALRLALGEDELNFLGYSYGSILAATYAERFTETVGAFVIDGATDPAAGSPDGPFDDGFATFADDGREPALARMVELCDATQRCLSGRSAADVLDRLSRSVDELPTDRFAGEPNEVDGDSFDIFVDSSLTYAGDWELLATALDDADLGDASALAALVGADQRRDEPGGEQDDGALGNNFSDANFLIYCADFSPLITRWSFCDAMPTNPETLGPVRPVDLARPMLIIGTEYDPLTPGKHAPEFAAAIGDATHMIWEGVGHTAFPGWTDCIDDAVAAQFLGDPVPVDGTRCAMVEGVESDAELGDGLFGFDQTEAQDWVADAVVFYDRTSDDPFCVARDIVGTGEVDDRLVSHVILDVSSDTAIVATQAAEARC